MSEPGGDLERREEPDGVGLEPTGAVEDADVERIVGAIERRLALRIERSEFHSGPLPDARSLGEYEAILPGLADRIVSMAEREQGNRHHLQRAEVEQPFKLAKRGQWIGGAMVVVVLAIAVYMVTRGHPVAGTVLATVDLVALAAVFITGRWPTRQSGPDEA